MKRITFGSTRNLNYKFFQYSKELNEQRGFSNSIDGERQGNS